MRGFSAGEFEGDKTARNSDYLNTAEFLAQVEISPRSRPFQVTRKPRSSGGEQPRPRPATATVRSAPETACVTRAIVTGVTLVDFLLARADEELLKASCSYDMTPSGDLRCSCDRPTSEVLELVAKADMIRRWRDNPRRVPLLRLLADDYVWHPDYRPEWHPLQ